MLGVTSTFAGTGFAQPSREPRPAELEARARFDGLVLNYVYNDSAGLRVLFEGDRVYWHGVSGPLQDMRGGGTGLRLTKVDDGIYFATWITALGGEDSIVFNFNDTTVFAHVLGGDGESTFQLDGEIHCIGDAAECEPPDTRPMTQAERMEIMRRNRQ